MGQQELPVYTNGSTHHSEGNATDSHNLGNLLKRHGDAAHSPSPDTVVDIPREEPLCHRCKPLPFVLTFTDLTYSVKLRKKLISLRGGGGGDGHTGTGSARESERTGSTTRTLLNSVSGEAKDGEILAVLGASGCGKTTLIDALANRIAKESLHGSINLNGEPLESRLLKVISAYVMQDDLLYPMLTVEETLMFAAQFRLPRALSHGKKKERVKNLMEQLGLLHVAKTIIGDETHRGISGGERRRVSIGIDIIHDPILLFLDEPTSGLDSTSAFMVVKVLKRIAMSGSIVIMSIHQPSSRVVSLLDNLLFLSRGQVVFRGPPARLHPFFDKFGRPIPENENRTEFALDQIRELENSPDGSVRLVEHFMTWERERVKLSDPVGEADVEKHVSLRDAISSSISRGKLVSGAKSSLPAGQQATLGVSTFANPMWVEIGVLLKRSFTNSRRFPERFAVRLASVVVTGFILATIFWQLDTSPKGVQERFGLLAFAMSTTFYSCADALPVFLQDRYIFMRETAYNAYRRSSYVLANVILGLPSLAILSAALASTTFFPVGLAGGLSGFAFYFLTILSGFWAGSAFVTFLSGVISHVMVGFTIVVSILSYFLLLSGFFITRQRIPSYWLWFHYISLIKYPYEAVLHNEFDDSNRCFVKGLQMFDASPLRSESTETKEALMQGMSSVLGMNITRTTCVMDGPAILRQQGVTQLSKWDCIWITLAWGFLFRALFYVALLLGSKNKRK